MSKMNTSYTGYSSRHIRRLGRKQSLSEMKLLSSSNLPLVESSDSEDDTVNMSGKDYNDFGMQNEDICENDEGI